MADVNGFFGDHRFLSNFWPSYVFLDNLSYRTVEHAYQAAKTLDADDRFLVRHTTEPGKVKRLSRKFVLRPDWDVLKLVFMEDLVRQKFTLTPALRDKLIATGDDQLVEANTWGDTFWGVCNGVGTNHLGRIIMQVREELSHG